MNKINYNKAMKERLAGVSGANILLHCCCAPCAARAVELLREEHQLTLYYCNPNITDESEYRKRFRELEKLGDIYNCKTIDYGYDCNMFYNAVNGLECEAEGGNRCSRCFELRLELTSRAACDYDFFATTLTVSPLKNSDKINTIGLRYEKYLPTDFKKENGYLKSLELSEKFSFYRQNYCGCEFSKRN